MAVGLPECLARDRTAGRRHLQLPNQKQRLPRYSAPWQDYCFVEIVADRHETAAPHADAA